MMSEETRKKMSESHKGKHHTVITKRKISESKLGEKHPMFGKRGEGCSMYGRHHTEESRDKMSKSHLGKTLSKEHCRKISDMNRGEGNGFFGKCHTKETIEKISRARCGKKNPMFGKSQSEEHRKKIREGNCGKTRSEETRRNISKARRGMFCGKENSQWQGGISFEPYCPKFNNEFKERVRAFFDYQCVECGTPQNGKRLHVHHVNFNKMSCCDGTLPLFVPLCDSCHPKTNNNREYWEVHFTEIINNYYQGRCYFTNNEMMELGI